jgi:hypothetical protein
MMRRALLLTAVLAAAVFFMLATLPPPPAAADGQVERSLAERTLAGAVHVHSTRSDGSGTKSDIAAAAARAGLQFVILTDHGDGTAAPDPPAYISGVLCLDAVEISTASGHYLAIGLPQAPYPLAGEASAVVEDVRRLGGIGFVAHPGSRKPELQWSEWQLPFDGIEWLNADSQWRDERPARLVRTFADYFVRPGPALAALLDRPVSVLARWRAAAAERPVILLGAHDAHGGLSRRLEDGERSGVLGVPSYEASFRSFAVRAVVDAPPVGGANEDGRRLLEAIRQGRVFTAIDGVARPAYLDFQARGDGVQAAMGDTIVPSGPLTMAARATMPPGGRLVLIRDGLEVAESPSGFLEVPVHEVGVYWVEGRAAGAPGAPPVPWILSNPIYVRAAPAADALPGQGSEPLYETVAALSPDRFRTETDPTSTAGLSHDGRESVLTFQLGADGRRNQYASLVAALPDRADTFDTIVFTARASRPLRLSVQLRFDRSGGVRWFHSVYLAPQPRRISVPLRALVSAGGPGAAADLAAATSLLFVVDTTNAAPGSAGSVWISDVSFSRPASGR